MRNKISFMGLLLFLLTIVITVTAQETTTVSGSVTIGKTKEAATAISVTIKGTTTGTFTDDKGEFKFSTAQKPPFVLVFSSVGYADKEVAYSGNGKISV